MSKLLSTVEMDNNVIFRALIADIQECFEPLEFFDMCELGVLVIFEQDGIKMISYAYIDIEDHYIILEDQHRRSVVLDYIEPNSIDLMHKFLERAKSNDKISFKHSRTHNEAIRDIGERG